MKLGLTLGAIVLASNVAFAQVAIDMATLERRVDDAQSAYERNRSAGVDEQEMTEIRDDLGYLRVKTRRGEAVTRTDRQRLSDRIDRFLTRMNTRASSSGVYDRDRDRSGSRNDRVGSTRGRLEIPSGTEVDVRLLTALTSDTAQVEDRVEATTMVDLYNGNDLLVPAGSTLTGWVTSVDRASRTDRKGSLTLEFNRAQIRGRSYDIRAYVTQALESEGIKGEVGRIGAGSAVGAIIGGILGGAKGAIAGILIGGGGVIAATEGKDVHLPEGTVLRVRFDSAVPLGN
ncbi:MAG TPA: hypothetical protein VF491_05480 [Vicinamibacterales bacterium]